MGYLDRDKNTDGIDRHEDGSIVAKANRTPWIDVNDRLP